jgi:hypothetical protein
MKFRNIISRLAEVVVKKPKLHFIHVGKTGGSAIAFALKAHTRQHEYHIQLHGHNTKLNDIPEGEKLFFCVRDPMDRFVSGFYSRQRQGRPKYNSPWRKEEKMAFKIFKTPNELALALSSEDAAYKAQAEFAMRSIAHVKSSYWDWFGDESYFTKRFPDILWVCHQDRLKKDFDVLKKMLHIPEEVALPGKHSVAAHANPDGLDRKLEDQAKRNLQGWYAADYHFLKLVNEIHFTD